MAWIYLDLALNHHNLVRNSNNNASISLASPTPGFQSCRCSPVGLCTSTPGAYSCSFMRPEFRGNKPKCVICGEERCDWKHLIFQCSKRPNCAQHFVDAMTSRLFALTSDENPCVSAAAAHSMIFLQRLWVDKNFDVILEFAFRICCFENGKPSPLRYRKVLVPIIEVTAREIGRVYNSWMDAAATQQ